MLMSFTHFSYHAFKRINQRTKLSCREIKIILDNGLAINTGSKPGSNQAHLLFYSRNDDNFFIAIQDLLTGTVVTVLPLEYQENLAWKISKDDCLKSKKIIDEKLSLIINPYNKFPPKIIMIKCHYLDGDGNRKTKTLIKAPSNKYDNDLDLFLSNDEIISKIDDIVNSNKINPVKIISFSVSLGNYGEPIFIDLM